MDTELLIDSLYKWFKNLDYSYMVLHLIVCYGLYFSDNMRWIVEWFSPVRKKGISKAVWVVGGILAIIEMIRFIPHLGQGDINYQKFISIFHSYIVIQVFVESFVNQINKWVNIFVNSNK